MPSRVTQRLVMLAVHRWAGLGASSVLSVAGLTGAVMVWPWEFRGRGAIGRIHETLGLHSVGAWTVWLAAGLAIVLQLTGLFLWWRRKVWFVRSGHGWRRTIFDIHHAAGFVLAPLMLVLAITAIGQPVVRAIASGESRRSMHAVVAKFHTARGFPAPVKVLYTLGSMGFLLQGVTGVSMWWRSNKRADRAQAAG
jgi:uncharacterized iron-regulated membrane protein